MMIIHLLPSSLNLANETAGVIGAIVVLLIVVSVIAVIIVIAIVCIIKRKKRKGVTEGSREADNMHHFFNVPQKQPQRESTPFECNVYDEADSKPYQEKYNMIGSGMYINSAAVRKESGDVPITQPNTKPSKSKHPEYTNVETPKNGNDPSELYTQPIKARKQNEELYVNHDQVDPDELYTQPEKKKKIKKPQPYASGRKRADPEALYTAVDKIKK